MACEICGRSSCTRCFHSLSEQEEFDTKTGRYAPEEDAPLEAEEEPETADSSARDEILRLLDQTDMRLAKGHVVHVGQLLDAIRAKLSPVA